MSALESVFTEPENYVSLRQNFRTVHVPGSTGGRLGQGAYGEVYLMRTVPSDITVAVKFFHGYTKPKQQQLISGEIQIMRHIRERQGDAEPFFYIVRYLDFIFTEHPHTRKRTPALVMQHLPGVTLKAYITTVLFAPPAPETMRTIMQTLLVALNFLHSNGIVHRDIKPENIIIRPEDAVCTLYDFGLACTSETYTAKTGGTPTYLSPEALRSFKLELPMPTLEENYAADVWALGMTFANVALRHHPLWQALTSNKMEVFFPVVQSSHLDTPDTPYYPANANIETIICGMLTNDHIQRLTAEAALTLAQLLLV